MNKLSIFAVTAALPFYAVAGTVTPAPVDEPSMVGLLVLGAAVVGALRLRAKFKK